MAGSGRNLLQALEYWGKEQPEKVRSLRGSGTASVTVEIGRQIGTDSDHHPPNTTRGGGGVMVTRPERRSAPVRDTNGTEASRWDGGRWMGRSRPSA